MTTIQLNAQKLEIIEGLMGITDEKILGKIVSLIETPKKKAVTFERIPGLAYTQEEREAAVKEAMEDYRAGRFISHEEMGRRIAQWGR